MLCGGQGSRFRWFHFGLLLDKVKHDVLNTIDEFQERGNY